MKWLAVHVSDYVKWKVLACTSVSTLKRTMSPVWCWCRQDLDCRWWLWWWWRRAYHFHRPTWIGCFVFDASHPRCVDLCPVVLAAEKRLSPDGRASFFPPFVFPTSFPAVRNFKRKSCLTLGLCHALGLGFGSVAGDSKWSQSFCQKCGWQVTAKHTCALCL